MIATGRREERLKTLKDELGDNLYIAQLDVRNRAAIETLIADLLTEWQAIDVLVNNAYLALGLESGAPRQCGRLGRYDRHQ